MKRTVKIIDKVYKVENDGKNCLYVSEDNGKTFIYSEMIYFNGTKVRLQNGGINVYSLSKKLQRRFSYFINNGFSIYAKGIYKYGKHFA